MITELNIDIFNYIYSKDIEIEKRIVKDNQELIKILDSIIAKDFDISEFWQENRDLVDENCIEILRGILVQTQYNHFPRLTQKGRTDFLNYKAVQMKEIIYEKGALEREDFKKIFLNIDDIARANILKFCKENNIIKFENEKTIIKGGQNGVAFIYYENIEPIITENKNTENKIITQNIYCNTNNGIINQTNFNQVNDDKLFEIVLEKLDLMQKESNLSEKIIENIKESCNKKNKNKVVELLKEIAMGTGTNLIASGILGLFGIM